MLKKFTTLVSICLLILLCISISEAQDIPFDKFILTGSGARAAGMGNAFTALSDDATAISWNSAGLTQLYSMEASVVGRFAFGTLGTDYEFADISVARSSKFQINFASFVVPFSVGDYNVVGGVALRRLMDFTEKQTFTANILGDEQEFYTDYSGGINAITPAVGVQLNDMLSFGAGLNILTGTLDYEDTDIDGFIDDEWSNEFSGASFDIGLMVKPNQKFSLGANINLPYTLTITEEGYDTEMSIPLFFSIGAAFRASDKLVLAADFRSRKWSDAEITEEDGETYALTDMIQDANSIHFGLEYLAESGDNYMPLRVGFYTEPTLGTDSNDDQIVYSALTGGIGFVMDQIILDGSFEYVFGSYTVDEAWINEWDVEYTYNDFRITLGGAIHLGGN